MAKLIVSDGFIDALANVKSPRIAGRIEAMVASLEQMPELGSPDVRKSIRARFAGRVRKIVISPFDVFYLYDPEKDEVHVSALVHHKRVR